MVMARAALEPQGKWDALHSDLMELYERLNLNDDGSFRVEGEYLMTIAPRAGGVSDGPNLDSPDFDEPREREGFRCRRARIGRQAGSERLGASLWALPPGQAAYPYHWHYREEELIVVLEGARRCARLTGERRLARGDVVSFRDRRGVAAIR